jgi:class 3 adenylate cyclase
VVGFTSVARARSAREVISILERLFSAFDELADEHGLEKIKTIGDAYMAVAGAPVPRPDHARAAANMALGMIEATAQVARELECPIELRVGMHCGPANAGVVGKRKFFYDLWGDAVNVASRMESNGLPGRVHVSAEVEQALRGEYRFEERGTIDVKGIGQMKTYFLLGRSG